MALEINVSESISLIDFLGLRLRGKTRWLAWA